MKIKINDRWWLDTDPYCWVLEEHKPPGRHPITREVGKGDSVTRTYHGTLIQAITHALEVIQLKSESLEELRRECVQFREDVRALAEGMQDGVRR